MRKIIAMCVVGIAGIGCGTATEGPTAARALGVVAIEIEDTDSTLVIRGFAETGDELARVDATTGRFVMRFDDRGEVFGRQLRVTVLGKTVEHESEGTDVLQLPLAARSASIATFLLDPAVSTPLARRGITFERAAGVPDTAGGSTGEVGYDWIDHCEFDLGGGASMMGSVGFAGPCVAPTDPDGAGPLSYIPSTGCTGTQFRLTAGVDVWGQYCCCDPSSPLGENALERRCATAGVNDGCGIAGPRGCAVCWNDPAIGGLCETGQETPSTCYLQYCAAP
jgi:hypothetical protein